MLEGINRLCTWECVCIRPQAPADRPATKQVNQHAGTTNMASYEGNHTRTLQKMLGTLRETLGMPVMLCHCQVTPGNAQPITPEMLKLSRERYKQKPECHSCACSWLTKLNTFNLINNHVCLL